MLEVRLPGVLQSVQETLRRQSEAKELQRRKDAAQQLRLQALKDEVRFIENTPLIPVMQEAASLLKLGFNQVWLVIRDPKDILEGYHPERLGIHLYWRNKSGDHVTELNQAQVFTTRDGKGEINGFEYNARYFSDLSLEKISEAVDQAITKPYETSIGWHFGKQIRIPKHK